MTRVALYARYSSDNQRDASIEDQLRICREKAEREKWTVVSCVYRKLKPGRNDGEARRGSGVNE